METQSPTPGRILIAASFALSCFGLLLFLWVAFGGPVPLKPESYRITVPFDEATQLAVESDVRISGVSVGKVKNIDLSDDSLADAELEIEPRFAPVPQNTRAILRQKTLLGETYVELTTGDEETGTVPEGGSLPRAQVSDAVQLDEIFRAFDEPTRVAFRAWMQEAAVAFRGRGADLNAALGNLAPFADSADDLLRVLDGQRNAVEQLIRDGGETFDALSERKGALRGLIRNTETVFSTTARRDEELRETFRALPTFLRESRTTLERLEEFSGDTDPLVTQLRPAARELSGTLQRLQDLSPELEGFFNGLDPVIGRAAKGFGALREVLDDQLPEPLARVDSYFDELIPAIQTVRRYRREVTAFLGNTAAAANGFNVPSEGGGQNVNYLRSTGPLGPDVLASFPGRLKVNRTNAYVKNGGYAKLDETLDSFLTGHCSDGLTALLPDSEASELPGDLFERIQKFNFNDPDANSTDEIPAPPCKKQPDFKSIGGAAPEQSDFLKVRPQP